MLPIENTVLYLIVHMELRTEKLRIKVTSTKIRALFFLNKNMVLWLLLSKTECL